MPPKNEVNFKEFGVKFDIKSEIIPPEIIFMLCDKIKLLAKSAELNNEKYNAEVYEISADNVKYAIRPDYGQKIFYVTEV